MSVPDLFTVTEAASILRVGRTTAYELATRDLASGGGEGLGVVRIGNQLRVRRAALEALLGGPVTWPPSTGTGDAGEVGRGGEDNVVRLAALPGAGALEPALRSSGSPSLPFSS